MSGHHDDSEGYDRRPDAKPITWAEAADSVRQDAEAIEARREALAEREADDGDWHDIVTSEYTTSPTVVIPMCPDPSAHDRRPAAEAGRADDDGGDVLDLDAIEDELEQRAETHHLRQPGPDETAKQQSLEIMKLEAELAKARETIAAAEIYLAHNRQTMESAHQGAVKLIEERDQLRAHILDIDAHATPYGDLPDDPGYVGMYLVTAGALHRALGKIGHTAPKCKAEAQLAEVTRERDDLVRLIGEVKDHVGTEGGGEIDVATVSKK